MLIMQSILIQIISIPVAAFLHLNSSYVISIDIQQILSIITIRLILVLIIVIYFCTILHRSRELQSDPSFF